MFRVRLRALCLRNPPLNVIDIPMMEELSRALAEIEASPTFAVIVTQRCREGVFRRRGRCRAHSRQS